MRYLILLLLILPCLCSSKPPVRIAVLDSGFDTAKLVANDVVLCPNAAYDAIADRPGIGIDHTGHGTAMALLVAKYAEKDYCLILIKVIEGHGITFSDPGHHPLILGLSKAVEYNAKILSLSLGGSNYSFLERTAFLNVKASKAITFTAAGNQNTNLDINCNVYPACFSGTASCVVGATTTNGIRAWYSNYGSKVDMWEDVTYTELGGTSSATAIAAGKRAKAINLNQRITECESL